MPEEQTEYPDDEVA